MKHSPIITKVIEPILVASVEGVGRIPDVNRDIDKLYENIYKNNCKKNIAGPAIVMFFTETGGRYVVAVSKKKEKGI